MNDKLAILRNMLWQMEVEVGLEQLPQAQKDVYYAACLMADDDQLVHSDSVKGHPMVALMARPTFYRALRDLVAKGFLTSASKRKDGRYFVRRRL